MVNTRTVGVVVVAVGVIAVGGAAAFVTGFGPMGNLGGGDSGDVTNTPESTGTVWDGSGGDGGSGDASGDSAGTSGASGSTAAQQQSGPPFSFTVQSISKCGQTCRDVTVKLTNNQDQRAEDVSVYTRIFAGKTTDKDSKIWEVRRDVGSLGAGESTTATSRVKLSYSEGYQVQQNDGWITIVTTVSSADKTITFKEQRDVQ